MAMCSSWNNAGTSFLARWKMAGIITGWILVENQGPGVHSSQPRNSNTNHLATGFRGTFLYSESDSLLHLTAQAGLHDRRSISGRRFHYLSMGRKKLNLPIITARLLEIERMNSLNQALRA